ncbi:thioesterase II family protein [Micromonospora chokoriensis]|uniref:Surfactin synthase thioesterase subunit n=1 Tax=Micromonospora chokoriensis TaxID=356851 RepID=A0A1C4XEP3_9ACTN|nr:alpha/beta fold hydrolase [Micromonospora chokoriensis]SCF06792.1 Surfactin synthase thioesterase subunit [Micromonospora chokoriensis]
MTSSPADPARWLRRFHPAAEDAVRLVCLPHAGGSASFFFPMSRALAPHVQVLAVQYPGRQDRRREEHVADLHQLADQVFGALAAAPQQPTALFGHSLGAVVAYEVALRMRDAGLPDPVRLFASARRAPSRYRDERVHRLGDAEIIDELRRLSGTHAATLADPELIQLILPAVRSDYQAIETYRHRPDAVLDCPVTVLTGADDPVVSAAEADDWRRHTTGEVEVRTFTGGHFFLVDHAPAVIELLTWSLTTRVAG